MLDTWFSSALWPFSTLGWPDDTPDLRAFYPTSVLVTGYDILFFWVARMMLFGLYAMADNGPEATPCRSGRWRSTAWCGTSSARRCRSRAAPAWTRWTGSTGSARTPPGSSWPAAPRRAATSSVSEDWVAGARNFCNKLWNAARFALLNGAVAGQPLPPAAGLTAPDRWILSRLARVTAEVDALYEQFEFAKVCEALYHFAWDEFCDWYLELAKSSLTGTDEAAADATRRVLGEVLDRLLRLMHPVIPFVTEELWTALTGGESIVIARWPGQVADGAEALPPVGADPAAEAEIELLMRVVTEVRRFRSDQGLRPGQPVPATISGLAGSPLAAHEGRIRSLLRLAEPGDSFAPPDQCSWPASRWSWTRRRRSTSRPSASG